MNLPPYARLPMHRLLSLALLVVLIAWGLRLTILEGFVYAWPRGFRGDFHAAMYEPRWWDGTGIMYGPIFVMERWLVNAWPNVFPIETFALMNVPLMASAFVLTASASGLKPVGVLVALAAWICSRSMYYSFSVAAHPEILELLLLTLAWWAASRDRRALAWLGVACAALTKVIPAIFAPQLLLRGSRRAVGAALAVGLGLVIVVGIGQKLRPLELVEGVLVPLPSQRIIAGQTVRKAAQIVPFPSSWQMLGLNSATARLFGLSDENVYLHQLQILTNTLTLLVYGLCGVVIVRVLQGGHDLDERTRLTLSYGIGFALMPLLTLQAHPHTFLFLLPVWTAVIALLSEDPDRCRAAIVGTLCLACYVLAGFNPVAVVVDRVLHTKVAASPMFEEPIWPTLATIATMSGFAWHLTGPDASKLRRRATRDTALELSTWARPQRRDDNDPAA